jgi:hypothetical protein
MIRKLWKIFINANKSIFNDANNKVNYAEIIIAYLVFIGVSIFMVVYKKEEFLEDSKIVGTVLSLFSGLMYSVLLKIPDKLSPLKTKIINEEDTLELQKETLEANIINAQAFNHLKNFSFTLSYSILVAIFCIVMVVIGSFFKIVLDFRLQSISIDFVNYDIKLTWFVLCVVIYRFIFIFFMLQFLYFITKTVIYLTDFTIFEFNNLDKK